MTPELRHVLFLDIKVKLILACLCIQWSMALVFTLYMVSSSSPSRP